MSSPLSFHFIDDRAYNDCKVELAFIKNILMTDCRARVFLTCHKATSGLHLLSMNIFLL